MSDPVNMFDDCRLAISTNAYFNKIRCVLEDNFNINTHFACSFEQKTNFIMVLDVKSGEISFRERTTEDKNTFNSKRVVVVHYFLQIAVWMIYNSLAEQPKALSRIFDNFYDFMFGPIMTSIEFYMDPKKEYVSELPSIYLDFIPIVTIVMST